MTSVELISQVKALADKASEKADEYSGILGSVQRLIVEHFGQNGLIAAGIALSVLALFVISRLAKITIATVKYLIIPAVGLAVLASFLTPYSFYVVLPVSVTACSLVLLFKG